MYDPWQTNGTTHPELPANLYVTGGIKTLASTGLDKRDGTVATLEWKPSDQFTSTLDAYYTKREWDNDRRSIEANLGNYPDQATYTNPIVGADNTLIGATVSGWCPWRVTSCTSRRTISLRRDGTTNGPLAIGA